MNYSDSSEKTDSNTDDRALLDALRDFPAPAPADGFYERAVIRAVHAGARRRRKRRLMTGTGLAVAAGIVLVLMSGLFFNADVPGTDDGIPGVSIALAQPQTVRLMFASTEALEDATLTVLLPDGVELAGFPGQREVSWETSLAAGRNVLPLKLVATAPAGGELVATLTHDNRNRTFRLRVDVS